MLDILKMMFHILILVFTETRSRVTAPFMVEVNIYDFVRCKAHNMELAT